MALRLPRLPRRRAERHPVRAQLRRLRLRHRRSSCSCIDAGKRIVEVPIPTYYGDEICYVNGVQLRQDVLDGRGALPPRTKMGFGSSGDSGSVGELRRSRTSEGSSHGRILRCSAALPPVEGARPRLLERPAGRADPRDGPPRDRRRSARSPRAPRARRRVRPRPTSSDGIPDEVGGGFDVVIAADVLEHVRAPGTAARRDRPRARARRAADRVASRTSGTGTPAPGPPSARFDYDQRGILDKTHLPLLHPQEPRSHAAQRRLRGAPAHGSGAAVRRAGARATARCSPACCGRWTG